MELVRSLGRSTQKMNIAVRKNWLFILLLNALLVTSLTIVATPSYSRGCPQAKTTGGCTSSTGSKPKQSTVHYKILCVRDGDTKIIKQGTLTPEGASNWPLCKPRSSRCPPPSTLVAKVSKGCKTGSCSLNVRMCDANRTAEFSFGDIDDDDDAPTCTIQWKKQ